MPFPIVPAPSTATVLMESIDMLHPFVVSEVEDAWDADSGQAASSERTIAVVYLRVTHEQSRGRAVPWMAERKRSLVSHHLQRESESHFRAKRRQGTQ